MNKTRNTKKTLRMAALMLLVEKPLPWTLLLLPLLWPLIAIAGDVLKSDGSDIGITIIGSILDKDTGNSVALIKETESGKVKAVRKNNIILDKNYKVIKVMKEYMVVRKKNSKVKHFVYRDKFGSGIKSTPNANAGPKELAAQDKYSEEGFERVRNGDNQKIKMTAMYRDKIVNEDLSKILMQASAIPFMENGAIVGFQLLQIDEGSIYDKAGLLNNDVITEINGTKLSSAAGAISLLRSLKGASNLDVVVLRGGAEESISVEIN